jgi:Zn-dependent protease with chaperone function
LFTNLVFIIIVLLLANFALELNPQLWSRPPLSAFIVFSFGYILLLLCILVMTKIYPRYFPKFNSQLLFSMNILIVSFLITGHFFLGAHRILNDLPFISQFDSIKALFSAGLYLFALGFYYFVSRNSSDYRKRFQQACQPIQLIIPFIIPFFLITLFFDLAEWFSNQTFSSYMLSFSNKLTGSIVIFLISMALMALMIMFLPPVILRLWQCQPLEASPLKERLDRLCQKAKFRHAGMLTWTIMNSSLTAAIIGVLPRFRYVLFTQRLLKELSLDSIEAILAHEIGHSYRKHLVIFPFIMMGMAAAIGLPSLFFGKGITTWFDMKIQSSPYEFWFLAYSLTLFLTYAGIMCLYFRLVFGLFSRLFERQADLHGFALGVDPQHMIAALDDIATATGGSHRTPNWHHYSIQQRMDFLKACMENPEMILNHHRRTRRYLIGYALILFVSTCFLLAPQLSHWPVFGEMDRIENQISDTIAQTLNKK